MRRLQNRQLCVIKLYIFLCGPLGLSVLQNLSLFSTLLLLLETVDRMASIFSDVWPCIDLISVTRGKNRKVALERIDSVR